MPVSAQIGSTYQVLQGYFVTRRGGGARLVAEPLTEMGHFSPSMGPTEV